MIAHQARHDQLTKLPNRQMILERLELAIQRARRKKEYNYALIFIDLDRFKVVNDSLGHAIGDKLLASVAKRLKTHLRETDLVARLGGDEFLVLLEDVSGIDDIINIAERMLADCKEPILINNHHILVGMSMGIVRGSPVYQQAESVIRNADIAMYRSKNTKCSSYEFFNLELQEYGLEPCIEKADLQKAISENELKPYYQPIIDLGNNQLVGFEALVRWHHPKRGLVFPQEFMPIAKKSGLIADLDSFVFKQACQQMSQWFEEYLHAWGLKIHINLSAQYLHRSFLLQDIDDTLRSTNLPGYAVTLDITEEMLISDFDKTIKQLNQLSERNIHIKS